MPDPSHESPAPASPEETVAFDFYVEELEAYLDGELEAAEATRVRQRLAEEPAYAASLARLQDHRRMRMACLDCDGPVDEAAMSRLATCASDLCSQRDEGGRWFIGPATRSWIGLAAACLIVGFGIGSLSGLDLGQPPADAVSNPVPNPDATGLVSDTSDDRRDPRPAVE